MTQEVSSALLFPTAARSTNKAPFAQTAGPESPGSHPPQEKITLENPRN